MARSKRTPASSQSYEPVAVLEDGTEDPATIGTWSNDVHDSRSQDGGESSHHSNTSKSEKRRRRQFQRSTTDAAEPLLSESDDDGTLVEDEEVGEEKTSDELIEEKKSFSKAEYTIALSHFIVSSLFEGTMLMILIRYSEYSLTQRGTISCF